jgi:hypothetical protein
VRKATLYFSSDELHTPSNPILALHFHDDNTKVKGKVKLFLCSFLTENHDMKAYWGVEL